MDFKAYADQIRKRLRHDGRTRVRSHSFDHRQAMPVWLRSGKQE